MSHFINALGLVAMLALLFLVVPASAEDQSFYSPIVHVDKDKGFIVISNSGKVFAVEVPEAAKPHLEKLPVSGMIDIVVEMRADNAPLLKTWKVAGGESSCKHFDGKTCK
jgi:ABC-type sugar transport system substrate-binding protein